MLISHKWSIGMDIVREEEEKEEILEKKVLIEQIKLFPSAFVLLLSFYIPLFFTYRNILKP